VAPPLPCPLSHAIQSCPAVCRPTTWAPTGCSHRHRTLANKPGPSGGPAIPAMSIAHIHSTTWSQTKSPRNCPRVGPHGLLRVRQWPSTHRWRRQPAHRQPATRSGAPNWSWAPTRPRARRARCCPSPTAAAKPQNMKNT
jgi:hypothetical protein